MNQFWKKEEGVSYDEERRRAASSRAVLYYLVACYVIYMGVCVLKNQFAGDDSIPFAVAIFFTVFLILGGFFVAWYATKRMKTDLAESVIKDAMKEIDAKEEQ